MNVWLVAAGVWALVASGLVATHEYNHCRLSSGPTTYGVRVNRETGVPLPQPYADCPGVRAHGEMRDPLSFNGRRLSRR